MPKTQVPALIASSTQIVATFKQDRRLAMYCARATENPEAVADLPADIRAALPVLIDDMAGRCAPLGPDPMTAEFTQTLALIGGAMPHNERVEWQIAMGAELQEVPADLARGAMQHARRTCRRAAEVLPCVIAYVEDYPARRRARLVELTRLADVAGVEYERIN